MKITMEHYLEIIKFHEQYKISTQKRNDFWRELNEELKK